MSKAHDMAKISAKGSFHLLWGLAISTIISSVGTIFIGNILGDDQYGLYAIVINLINLIIIFRDWGINLAITRFAAQYRAEEKTTEIRSIFTSGLIFEITISFALSITAFVFADFFATLFSRPNIVPLIQIAAFSIIANGLVTVATAIFTGLEKMVFNSVMLVCQSIIKTVVIITLVYVGLGPFGAITGYTSAMITAGLIGTSLVWVLYRKLPKPTTTGLQITKYLKIMLTYSVPLSFSVILLGFQTYFFSNLLPLYYSDNIIIGNYGIANTFVVLITFFALPITTMLLPAFSKLDHKKHKETLQNVFQSSVKYAALFVVPVAALVMVLAEPAVSTLFQDKYQTAPLFLSLLAITYLYTALGSLSTGNIISGQGDTKLTLKLALITATIGFPMGYTLIMLSGVLGLIATMLISGLPSLLIGLWWIKKHYGVTIDWIASAKILTTSLLAAALTYFTITQSPLPNWIRLITGTIFFTTVFLTVGILTKTITKKDTNNLRQMLSTIGPITKTINTALTIIEKTIDTLRT